MQHLPENSDPKKIGRLLGQKRGSRSSSIDPGHGRKDSKARADQTSVRSHSSDIVDAINKDMEATGIRLQNQNKTDRADNTMTMESGRLSNRMASSRSSGRSRKSLSSDGSLNKRKIKSNSALLSKQFQIMKGQDGQNDDEDGKNGSKKPVEAIDDETASEIFNKLTKMQGKKTYYAKKNWTDDEAKLLQWAIQKYSRRKGITPQKLDKNDWIQIAGFIPGRNDSQCQYKFNQDKKSTIQKSNWVKREDEELVRLIRDNGTKQWSQIANQLNANLKVTRNGKQCRERWVNFLNPEIKKDPFSLEEDILILKKRLSIGNKWSEIIKEMPGRTENNVKNRFNMMFKNIKDEFIKNRTHQSVFVMQEKVDQDQTQVEDQIDEESLIRKLIEKKTKELEDKKLQPSESATKNDMSGDISMKTGNQNTVNNNVQDLSDSASNTNMNESSRRSFTNPSFYNGNSSIQDPSNSNAQTAQWANQKEFLKMSNICQNKEQINHAIERLILNCPAHVNLIKRLVEYIQEDINRMIRINAAYASNTSIGSTTNNLMGTPGNNNARMLDRNQSPNQNTLDHLSNHSISPSGEPRSTGLSGNQNRQPYHQNQILIGQDGQNNLSVVQTQRPEQQQQQNVYNSLIDAKNEAPPKTPVGANLNKSPMGTGTTLIRLPNGQIIQTAVGVSPQQNGRALTPNQRMGATPYQSSSNSQFTNNRSMSPLSSEMPGEKQFVETSTGETLIVTQIGIYASRKGEDRYVHLQFPEQILFAPFVQLQSRRNASMANNYVDRTPKSNINEPPFGGPERPKPGAQISQGHPTPPMDPGLGKHEISPGQFLYSVKHPDGSLVQQPGGQIMIVQGLNQVNGLHGSGRIQGRSASTNAVTQRLITPTFQNPQLLASYQPNAIAQPADLSGLQNLNFNVVNNGQQFNQSFFTNSSSQGQKILKAGVPAQVIQTIGGKPILQNANGPAYNTNNSSGIAVDSKIGSSQSNIPMHVSGLSGQVSGANLSGNNPLSFKGAAASQLPKQPQFNFPPAKTAGSSTGQMSQNANQDKSPGPGLTS